MDNIQRINELRRGLNELRQLGTTFKSDMIEIGNAIDHERFAPTEGLKTWGDHLLAWMKKSADCLETYTGLFKEPLPDKFSDVEKLLDAEENRIRAANVLIQAEKFLHFTTKSPVVKNILQEHQSELTKLLARKRQNTRLKTTFEIYAKFVDAMEEQDIGKKFSMSTELREFFGDDFIGRTLFGGEFSIAFDFLDDKLFIPRREVIFLQQDARRF